MGIKNTIAKAPDGEKKKSHSSSEIKFEYTEKIGSSALKSSIGKKPDHHDTKTTSREVKTDARETKKVVISRSVRLTKNVGESKSIDIEPPRAEDRLPQINWVATFLPAIATCGISVLVSVISANPMMMLYTMPMAFVGIFLSIYNYFSSKKRHNLSLENRREEYLEYLDKIVQQIKHAQNEYVKSIYAANPTTEECIAIASERSSRLWERTPDDTDFAFARIGVGTIDSNVTVNSPKVTAGTTGDELREKAEKIEDQYKTISHVPIVFDFHNSVNGLVGERKAVKEELRNILIQLTTNHCYTELRLVVILDAVTDADLMWVSKLPHVNNEKNTGKNLSTTREETEKLFKELLPVFDARKEGAGKTSVSENLSGLQIPYYLFVILSPDFIDKTDPVYNYIFKYNELGLGALVVEDTVSELPTQCKKIIQVNGLEGCCYSKFNTAKKIKFKIDPLVRYGVSDFSSAMEPLVCDEVSQIHEFPAKLTLLELFKSKSLDELQLLQRWNTSNPTQSLSTPVGVDISGDIIALDMGEKSSQHGPHGLVAGTTGSGKSQFLITYILSMAINYHPDEVAFVLIDYKGGGLAGAFDSPKFGIHLPHVMAGVTNLDGATVMRSLRALNSELQRRQRLFAELKNSLGIIDPIDIYHYQKLYREGKTAESLPHLFIICDEFRELKEKFPAYVNGLISVATIGRSLGFHLILATQKPSGIVSADIKTNTRCKVCLKVSDESDSKDVIGQPDAANIKEKGRLYLRADDFFLLGQAAWSGAEYKTNSGERSTELAEIVKFITKTAHEQRITQKYLWLPELPEQIEADVSLCEKDKGVCFFAGKIDDPDMQQQYEYSIDFTHSNHMLIVGDAGSGKTTFLETMILSLAARYSPEDVNFYILDYSNRMLSRFKNLPHCGAVLLEEESDSLDLFFETIDSFLRERKKLFSEYGVPSYEEAKKKKQLPLIFVVIDNISGLLTSKKGETHKFKLAQYMKGAANYGIIYIITSSSLHGLTSSEKSELTNRIAFHLKDSYAYSDALNVSTKAVEYLPADCPGRGMVLYHNRVLEIQFAQFFAGLTVNERNSEIKRTVGEIADKFKSYPAAKKLPVFSETAEYSQFAEQFGKGYFPIGFEKSSGKAVALPYMQFSTLGIYFGNRQGKLPILKNLLFAAEREKMDTWLVPSNKDSYFEPEKRLGVDNRYIEKSLVFESSEEQIPKLWREIYAQFTARKVIFDEYCLKKHIDTTDPDVWMETFDYMYQQTRPIMVIFENYEQFCTVIDPVSSIVMQKLLTNARRYNMYFIACTEPCDLEKVKNNALFSGFCQENIVLLFGGNFDKQGLCFLPETKNNKLWPNAGLMLYRDKFYPIVMPCGSLPVKEENPWIKPIL